MEWRKFKVKAETVKSYDLILRGLCLFLRDPEIEDITTDDIIKWFQLQEKLRWDRNGFIPKAIAVRKILTFCQMEGMEVLNPELIPVPDAEYRQARVLSEENYQKLLDIIPKDGKDPRHIRNDAMIRMYWDTGVRNTELMTMDVDDLDLTKMQAVIRTEKAKTRVPMRQIFWTESTNEALRAWLERRERLFNKGVFLEPDALFISIGGGKYGERLTKKGVGEMLRKYSRKAGIVPSVNCHSFRHHFGEEWAESGANDSIIASMLGHSSITSSFRYTMLNDKAKERLYRQHHAGDQKFGENPVKRFEAPATVKKKRDRQKERAALEIKRDQLRIEFLARKQKEFV